MKRPLEHGKGSVREQFGRVMRVMGPGLITGAADDDPSGIATYSQTGAAFGYGQLWTSIFLYPLMTAVQEACARIGVVTKKGVAAAVRERHGRTVVYGMAALIVVANALNIGADIGAMAEAARLIVPIVPFVPMMLAFVIAILLIEIFISYPPFARLLKWMLLAMLTYPLTLILVSVPWPEVLRATFVPHIESGYVFLFTITAVLGTTISPYMFFWEASEEVEEELARGHTRPGASREKIRDIRIDNALGMLFSQAIMWCIIVVTGTVLHGNGVTNIRSAADAARAILPLVQGFPHAGFVASSIFALGIIGLGFISVPVLAGSAAYAVTESFGWRHGLSRTLRDARGFYAVITLSTIAGVAINFLGIDPVQALVVVAVINSVVSIPLLYMIIAVSSDAKVMRGHENGRISKTLLWLTFFAILGSTVSMILAGLPAGL